jgi:hypothetical protein
MSRYMARICKQKSRQRPSTNKVDQGESRKKPLARLKRLKVSETAGEPNGRAPFNATTAADSLMELHVETRSTDTDMGCVCVPHANSLWAVVNCHRSPKLMVPRIHQIHRIATLRSVNVWPCRSVISVSQRNTVNAAGGVVFYRYLQSATTCQPTAAAVDSRVRCTNNIVGDVCFIEIKVDSQM